MIYIVLTTNMTDLNNLRQQIVDAVLAEGIPIAANIRHNSFHITVGIVNSDGYPVDKTVGEIVNSPDNWDFGEIPIDRIYFYYLTNQVDYSNFAQATTISQ